jgi:hypothetical protein
MNAGEHDVGVHAGGSSAADTARKCANAIRTVRRKRRAFPRHRQRTTRRSMSTYELGIEPTFWDANDGTTSDRPRSISTRPWRAHAAMTNERSLTA